MAWSATTVVPLPPTQRRKHQRHQHSRCSGPDGGRVRRLLADRGYDANHLRRRFAAGPRLWHAHLTLDAARRGQGVALTNLLLLNDDLQTGRLVQIETQPASVEVRFGAYVFRARRDR